MSILVNNFTEFLQNIALTDKQREQLISAHRDIREQLNELMSEFIHSIFLQGSYARNTINKPQPNEHPDVDIIVVTNINANEKDANYMKALFTPFLEKYYKGKYKYQSKSFGIKLTHIDIDLVPTALPSRDVREALFKAYTNKERVLFSLDDVVSNLNESKTQGNWKSEPLLIPNFDKNSWERTHPLAQIAWCREKNSTTNGFYIKVVKAIKWWRNFKQDALDQPKSYPLERYIGEYCPDSINSVAEGVVLTLEKASKIVYKPILPDPGVPEHDVFSSITSDEYNSFLLVLQAAAIQARKAYNEADMIISSKLWFDLFGHEFPESKKPVNQTPNVIISNNSAKPWD